MNVKVEAAAAPPVIAYGVYNRVTCRVTSLHPTRADAEKQLSKALAPHHFEVRKYRQRASEEAT